MKFVTMMSLREIASSVEKRWWPLKWHYIRVTAKFFESTILLGLVILIREGIIQLLPVFHGNACLCQALRYYSGDILNNQSENKTRATWQRGRWRREKWEREPVSIFLTTLFRTFLSRLDLAVKTVNTSVRYNHSQVSRTSISLNVRNILHANVWKSLSSNSSTASANLALDHSKCCRFCTKNLTYIRTKVPRISLFNVVKNKALLAFTGTESLVLADVLESLGHNLLRSNQLSQVSCLTCVRTLMRLYATFTKLVSGSNGRISPKRLCSNSATEISPVSKRTREDGAPRATNSWRCLALAEENTGLPQAPLVDNMAGISFLENAMDSRRNISAMESVQQPPTITEVRCPVCWESS